MPRVASTLAPPQTIKENAMYGILLLHVGPSPIHVHAVDWPAFVISGLAVAALAWWKVRRVG